MSSLASSDAALRGRSYADHRTSQRSQRDPALAVVDQSPLAGAFITQPEMFNQSLLLPGAHKRWYGRFARFGKTIGFYQKQFALS